MQSTASSYSSYKVFSLPLTATCSYTIEYCDSSDNICFGDVCCYVECSGTVFAIVKKFSLVSTGIISYTNQIKLAKHIFQVDILGDVCALLLDKIEGICIKIDVSDQDEFFVSKLPNVVERS